MFRFLLLTWALFYLIGQGQGHPIEASANRSIDKNLVQETVEFITGQYNGTLNATMHDFMAFLQEMVNTSKQKQLNITNLDEFETQLKMMQDWQMIPVDNKTKWTLAYFYLFKANQFDTDGQDIRYIELRTAYIREIKAFKAKELVHMEDFFKKVRPKLQTYLTQTGQRSTAFFDSIEESLQTGEIALNSEFLHFPSNLKEHFPELILLNYDREIYKLIESIFTDITNLVKGLFNSK